MLFMQPQNLNKHLQSLMQQLDVPMTRDFAVQIEESDSAVLLTAELPGINKSNIDIDFNEGKLFLNIKQTETKGNTENVEGTDNAPNPYKVIYSEFRQFNQQRAFQIGNNIDTQKISAQFDNGHLKITLPKLQGDVTKKKIEIV